MALLFCDSMEHYSNSDIGKKWTGMFAGTFGTEVQQGYLSDGPFPWSETPGGIYSNATNNRGMYKTLPSTYATGGAGCWIYFKTSVPSTSVACLMLIDGTSIQVDVRGDGLGHLTVTRGGTVLATSTKVVQTNTWYWMELKATINNVTGVIQLQLNGEDWVASTSGLNTRSTANNQFTGVGIANTNISQQLYKGIVVWDTSGAVCNTLIGPCQVICLRPRAAGNYSQWTAATGKNFGQVYEEVYDGDTSWNGTTVAGNIDTFKFRNLPAGTVLGIQHCIAARQDGGAARTIAPMHRIGGVDYAGTTVGVTASYVYYLEVKTLSPATTAQWTVAEINGAEFGYKLVT